MKAFAVSAVLLTLCAASALTAQEGPPVSKPEKEHQLLHQFVGEWESEMEASIGPGQPATKCKGTQNSRMLGEFWIVSETKMDMAGMPMHGLQTIGYDPKTKKYVGTWVDSMMNHMWKYSGSVDATGKILTLDAKGPDFTGGDKLVNYRDVYEFKSNDHIIATSQMEGPDGKWITFMNGNVKRKASKEQK